MKKDEAARKTPPELTSMAPVPGVKIRILLADDQKIIREGLKSILKYEDDLEVVAEADDGQLAMEMVERHKPDIVLMDVSMPVIDGVEAAGRIVAKFPDIKIIGLSLYDEDAMIAKMMKVGAVAFLSKVDAYEDLAATIHNCYMNNPVAPENLDD